MNDDSGNVFKVQELEVRVLNKAHVDEIISLESKINGVAGNDLNTRKSYESYVESPNLTLGIYDGDELVAVSSVVDAIGTECDLSCRLKSNRACRSVNYSLILINDNYHGLGLQRILLWIFERYLWINEYTDICSSIIGDCPQCLSNMLKFGFVIDHVENDKDGNQVTILYKSLNNMIDEFKKTNFFDEPEKRKGLLYTYDEELITVGDVVDNSNGNMYTILNLNQLRVARDELKKTFIAKSCFD